MNRAWLSLRRFAPLFVLSGCYFEVAEPGDEDVVALDAQQEVSSVEAAFTSTSSNPPLRVTLSGALPPLAGTSANNPGGSNQLGDVLNVPPIASTVAWKDLVYGDSQVTPSGTKTRIDDIVDDAQARTAVHFDDMDDVYDTFEDLSFVDEVRRGTPSSPMFAYVPERVRWLDSRRTSTATTSFADPSAFDEHRSRGGRLYCAAKVAFNRGKGSSGDGKSLVMGRKSLATLRILGSRIDIMSLEPTFALGAPQKRAATTNDGVQAFNLRMAVGTRFTPISLLPTTPEIRTRVNFITADAEVLTKANNTSTTYEQWQTATHADAIISGSREDKIILNDIPLFTIGPVPVILESEVTVGTISCSNGTNFYDCDNGSRDPVRRLWGSNQWAGFPAQRSGGFTVTNVTDSNYNDNFWSLDGTFARIGGSSTNRIPMPSGSPEQMRFFTDDDKALDVRTSAVLDVRLTAGLKGEDLGFPSFIDFAVTVTGGLDGSGSMVHEIREEMYASKRVIGGSGDATSSIWVGETGLSVTPHTEMSLGASINGVLKFLIKDIPFIGTLNLGGTLFDHHTTITSDESKDWPEANRVRIGTGSSDSNGAHWTLADTKSHLPATPGAAAATEFTALPSSISTCINDTEPTGDLEAPCGSVTPTYPPNDHVALQPPRTNLCFIAKAAIDPNDCMRAAANFTAVHTTDAHPLWDFGNGVPVTSTSMILDLEHPNDWTVGLLAVAQICAQVHRTEAGVKGDIAIASCDDHGNPYKSSDAITFAKTGPDGPSHTANRCY